MSPLVREMLVPFFLSRGGWTSESPNLIVQLTDDTEVAQVQGVFKARRKRMSMAALVPGLAVHVEGAFNEKHEVLAKLVKFKGNDLDQAQAIQAGLHETQAQTRESARHRHGPSEQGNRRPIAEGKVANTGP